MSSTVTMLKSSLRARTRLTLLIHCPRFDCHRLIQRRCYPSSYWNPKDEKSPSDMTSNDVKSRREIPQDGVTLSDFIASKSPRETISEAVRLDEDEIPMPVSIETAYQQAHSFSTPPPKIKFHLRTYGCQMNVSDSDIVRSILLSNSNIEETQEEMEADVLLTNTCAIRENAETKIWHRLQNLRALDLKRPKQCNDGTTRRRIIGVLGCMAERLKEDMFRDGTADMVVGPDAYRDLPRLIYMLSATSAALSSDRERALNVQLSFDETYADVKPVRSNPDDISAFVSVMRGCNNMCSYCVVPWTRGRERSRELVSIVDEVKRLYEENNVKEIILLGQNVNSYHDKSPQALAINPVATYETSNHGFTNMFRLRGGGGFYFSDLIEEISDLSPELRVRFTSPHPKDYPTALLELMAERHNVCKQLHMPAQSGSTQVLQRMRRGYTRETYIELIETVRSTIPDVSLSSDFISGFCGETEDEHRDTITLMESIQFDQAFMFAYSMREKTHAHRKLADDVTPEIKLSRLNEVISTFREVVQSKNDREEVGRLRVVLVEGESRRSENQLNGRTDQNKRILFPNESCLSRLFSGEATSEKIWLKAGDYAVVQVLEARGHTLRGRALWRTTLQNFKELNCVGSKELEADVVQRLGKYLIPDKRQTLIDVHTSF